MIQYTVQHGSVTQIYFSLKERHAHDRKGCLSIWFSNIKLLLVLRNNFRSNIWDYIINSDTYNEMNDYISLILANDDITRICK